MTKKIQPSLSKVKIIKQIKTIYENLLFNNILNPDNDSLYGFTKTFFNLIEWLIVLTTLRFVEIRSNNVAIKILYNLCFFIWCLFIQKKILDNIVPKYLNYLINKNSKFGKKLSKHYFRYIIISFILGIAIGLMFTLFINQIIDDLLISL